MTAPPKSRQRRYQEKLQAQGLCVFSCGRKAIATKPDKKPYACLECRVKNRRVKRMTKGNVKEYRCASRKAQNGIFQSK